jgi:hypothetical protein
MLVSASASSGGGSAPDARVRAEVVNARAEWLSRRLSRQRRRCAEDLARFRALSDAGTAGARGRLDLGDLAELEDVAPTLYLVDDPAAGEPRT